MMKPYSKYYLTAFEMLKSNLVIFFVALILEFGSKLNVIFTNITHQISFINGIFFLIAIPYNLLSIGYLFVPTIAFNDISERKKVSLQSLLNGIKRMFFKTLPLILVWIAIELLWYGVINPPPVPRLSKDITVFGSLLITLIYPMFSYFRIFFAVKNESFVSSIKDSLKFTKTNLQFTYLITPFLLLNWFTNRYSLFSPYGNNISFYIYHSITIFLYLVIDAAFLLYYKDNKDLKKETAG